jgi:hypothetical protein
MKTTMSKMKDTLDWILQNKRLVNFKCMATEITQNGKERKKDFKR